MIELLAAAALATQATQDTQCDKDMIWVDVSPGAYQPVGAICEKLGLDEIVVTPSRRAQSTKYYAGNIKVLDADKLNIIAAEHPSEILARVPGAFIHRGSGQEHLTAIRSPVLTGGAGAGSFLYLLNGIPLRSAGFANVNGLFEAPSQLADGIEVIRGPSGAQYGANAIHGVINLSTPLAGIATNNDDTYVDISASKNIKRLSASHYTYGDHGYLRTGISLFDDTGFRQNSGSDKQQLSFSYAGKDWDVLGPISLTFTNLNQETAGFVEGVDAFEDEELRLTNANPEAFRDAQHAQIQTSLNFDMGDSSLTIQPFARWNEQDFLLHFLPSQALEQSRHWSFGFQSDYRLNKDDDGDENQLNIGLDAEYTEGFLREFQSIDTVFSFTQGLHYDYEATSLNISPFLHGRHVLNTDNTLTLDYGVRLDHTAYEYANLTDDGLVGRFLRLPDRDDEFTTISPTVALRKEWQDAVGWLSYNQGARPPQTTDLYRLQTNQVIDDVEPESTAAIEVGYRKLWNKGRVEIAAYYQTKENFYFRDADGFNVTNGKTRHTGIEVDIDYALTEILRFSTNATYAEHTYQFDRLIASGANPQEAINSGDDIDTAPRTLANTRLSWTPITDITAELSWQHVGSYFLDASNINDYEGHDIFDLRASKQFENMTLYGSVRNLFDTRYAERADFAFGDERYFPDQGRIISIGLRITP